jgi:hypothetical protein
VLPCQSVIIIDEQQMGPAPVDGHVHEGFECSWCSMEIRDLGDVRRGYILGVSIVTCGVLTPRLVFADTC